LHFSFNELVQKHKLGELEVKASFQTRNILTTTRNSAIADKPRDAIRGQSRSPNDSIC